MAKTITKIVAIDSGKNVTNLYEIQKKHINTYTNTHEKIQIH